MRESSCSSGPPREGSAALACETMLPTSSEVRQTRLPGPPGGKRGVSVTQTPGTAAAARAGLRVAGNLRRNLAAGVDLGPWRSTRGQKRAAVQAAGPVRTGRRPAPGPQQEGKDHA